MTEKGFNFDYSKCVGCHACLVACYNENKTQPPISWRQVQTYNRLKVPLSGFINLSIACNHCIDAPCLNACPANAYEKDSVTGAIIHHSERCIGCRYCTWACPFDAPQFNQAKGVVEKCNLCNSRLKEGLIPACTNACPTGALSYGDIEVTDSVVAPGLSIKHTKPRINLKNGNIAASVPLVDLSVSGFDTQRVENIQPLESKIDSFSEWPLVLFTLIAALLEGWMINLMLNPDAENYSYTFGVLGILGMALSTLHLGKPLRAYRSVLNFKSSWLSREILFFTAFFGASLFALFIGGSIAYIILAVIIGILLLFAIEFVYSVTDKKYSTPIHSANTVLTAVTLGFMLSGYSSIAVGLIAIKGILYLVRFAYKEILSRGVILSFIRFFVGIMVPLVNLLFLTGSVGIVVIAYIFGELIDRFEFYNDIHVDTPHILMNTHRSPYKS
ncbi:MAG: DmsC/YnfH family molybdoenzyme membrane anchor subunit [Bacteroidales bacterium]